MPVLAGSPVTAIVRPRTRTPGRPAAAVSPAGLPPRAGVRAHWRRPDGGPTRTGHAADAPRRGVEGEAARDGGRDRERHGLRRRARVDAQPQPGAAGGPVLAR